MMGAMMMMVMMVRMVMMAVVSAVGSVRVARPLLAGTVHRAASVAVIILVVQRVATTLRQALDLVTWSLFARWRVLFVVKSSLLLLAGCCCPSCRRQRRAAGATLVALDNITHLCHQRAFHILLALLVVALAYVEPVRLCPIQSGFEFFLFQLQVDLSGLFNLLIAVHTHHEPLLVLMLLKTGAARHNHSLLLLLPLVVRRNLLASCLLLARLLHDDSRLVRALGLFVLVLVAVNASLRLEGRRAGRLAELAAQIDR